MSRHNILKGIGLILLMGVLFFLSIPYQYPVIENGEYVSSDSMKDFAYRYELGDDTLSISNESGEVMMGFRLMGKHRMSNEYQIEAYSYGNVDSIKIRTIKKKNDTRPVMWEIWIMENNKKWQCVDTIIEKKS